MDSATAKMAAPALDHLILFLPANPALMSPMIPSPIKEAFTLAPGGTHADGLSSNTLILLADGCYIELICFLPQDDPSKIANHWWGPNPKRKGWTDWCLTTTSASDQENWERVKDSHAQPVEGGRKRPDGLEVKWSVTFPSSELGGQAIRGKVPFFCHDKTPRDHRVPLSKAEYTKHPSGVVGVKSLTVIVATQEVLDKTWKVYNSVLGVEGIQKGNDIQFEVGRIHRVLGEQSPGANVILRLARSSDEAKKVEESDKGFWFGNVVLAGIGNLGGEGKQVGTKVRVDEGEDDVEGIWIEYVG